MPLRQCGARILRNLWLVPESRLADDSKVPATRLSSRLCELRRDFEYSIVQAAGGSSEAAALGQSADGIVLVLAAHVTRRAMALKIRETLEAAQVRLLGTVLSERRFPFQKQFIDGCKCLRSGSGDFVSSSIFNPGPQGTPSTDTAARLIPGVAPTFRRARKRPPQPEQPGFAAPPEQMLECDRATKLRASQTAAALLLPSPLRSRTSRNWLRLVTADFAFVSLNWLLVGAVRVQVGRPVGVSGSSSLLGIALLHAALITLLGYSEGLYAAGTNLPQQLRMLGKSVLWATSLLSLAYSSQGAPPNLIALVFGAGSLNFVALLAWRWEDLRRERLAGQSGRALRNVLIVGAGGLGRRVAEQLENHPEEGRAVCGFLDDEQPIGNGVIGRVNNLARLARTAFVDEVLLAAPHDRELTLRVLHDARRLRLDVEMVPDLFGCSPEGAEVERLGDLPLICLHEERLPAAGLLAKRALDIVAASPLCWRSRRCWR